MKQNTFNRIDYIKKEYLNAKPSISIHRARAFTKIYKEYFGLPIILLRAKAFRESCNTAPIVIFSNELIVSHPAGKRRAGEFSPDISWKWLKSELHTVSTRAQDPYDLSEIDQEILEKEIFPFWEKRSLEEIAEVQLQYENLWDWNIVCDLSIKTQNGGGDTCPGYDNILLTKGVGGIKKEAQEKLNLLSLERKDDIDKIYYYKSVIEICDGIIEYARRYAQHALIMSECELDPSRKKELKRISHICQKVPEFPPKNFYEALQSVWFIQSLFTLEENQTGISLGRADQYLMPFYENDIKNNILTKEEACELISVWLIKMSEIMWLCSESTAMYFAGYQPFINLVVGGQKPKGGDATNELTFMIMDCSKALGLYQPSLAVRIHNSTPHELMKKVVEVIKTGMGFPACHFDDAHIKMMLSKGFSFEDARDYCLMGCVEPHKSGKLYQWTSAGYTTWPVAIEMAFYNGIYPYDGKQHGICTGSIENFNSYEEFEQAVKLQIQNIIKKAAQATLILQNIHKIYAPKPFVSCFIEGCMETGKNVMDGGASINHGPGLIWTGLADYANSMCAIKTLVFETKKYSLMDIKNALKSNFNGYKQLREECLNAPKYGNDCDEVDDIAKDLVSFTESEHRKYQMLYGPMAHGTLSISNNTPFGKLIGALPSGRFKGAPLSDGISPAQQTDINGPTAIIKSVSKLNPENMSIGQVHNLKLLHGSLNTQEAERGLIYLLKSASMFGNAQMQFSYIDNQTLIKAQKYPEDYRSLMIRVAGYSAFFVELSADVQNEIISRTTLSLL